MDPLVLLLPIEPASNGNGLAQRAARFVNAATKSFDVTLCVIPVAGTETYRPPSEPGVPSVVLPLGWGRGHRGAELVTSPQWRARLDAALPFPSTADLAPPTMAEEVARTLGEAGVKRSTPLHTMRLSLAPLGLALAEQLGSSWRTLDLDDDETSLAATAGSGSGASAVERLLLTFAPLFDGICAAAPLEAAALGARLGLDVSVVRNSVTLPELRRERPEDPPLLLFVGNLTYPPNVYAASYLASEVLPRVAAALRRPANLTLAGPYDASLGAVSQLPGVHMTGYVDDLGPLYERASVMVTPLFHGAGTSIKLLEAFSRGIPVVTTRTGARGLAVRDGVHVLFGENPVELAEATVRIVREPELGRRLALEARAFVERNHVAEMAETEIAHFLLAASGRNATVLR